MHSKFTLYMFFFFLGLIAFNGHYEADREVNGEKRGEMAFGCDLGQT